MLASLLMAPMIAPPDLAAVSVKLFRFGPDTLLVRAGTVVTWRNEDAAPHSATGEGFDLALPSKDSRASHRFTAAGTFAYRCSRHSFRSRVSSTPRRPATSRRRTGSSVRPPSTCR